MSMKYLAYISPTEEMIGKEFAYCNVTFITGDLDHRTFQGIQVRTDMFRYYYYGSSLEVVELDQNRNIVDIHDMTIEDVRYFGVSIHHILTLNSVTFDMLASNDFTYNLKVNKFYNYCKRTVENIYDEMQRLSDGFALRIYVINGAIIYIELDDNSMKKERYVLSAGYIVSDKYKLRNAGHVENPGAGKQNEKLKQEEIDKLITRLIS